MAFIDFIIDIVRNGTTLQQKINVEPDATDATKIAPARVLQLNGKPLANNNALPVSVITPSWATETTLANLSSRLPSALVSGRLSVDGSAVTQPVSGSVNIGNFPATQAVSGSVAISNFPATQPISGSVSVSNFPATQPVSGTVAVSNAFALDATAIAIRDRLPTALVNNRFAVDSLIRTATINPVQYNTIGTLSSGVIKNSGGGVYSVSCVNLNASIRYLQLFNKTTALTGTDVPIESFAVYGNGGQLLLGQDYFTINGLDFDTGIAWGISTTPLIYTAATAAETIFTARYL